MEDIDNYKNVPVKVAAELLGVSMPFIREGIKSGSLPIGSAVQVSGNRWAFQISPGLLREYITGSKALKKYFEENKEILKNILDNKNNDYEI